MKSLITLFTLFILQADLHAQTRFIHSQDWESIKESARKGQKMIFVDAYTDWCGWCKVMDDNTFSNPAIGNMMDQYFINVKLEMEKDELGRKLALKYAISSFPTYLIFNEKGEMIYQIVGYQAPAEFMASLSKIIMPENHIHRSGYSPGFDIVYPEFYLRVMGMTKKKKFPDKEDLNEWVAKNNDLGKEANWTVYQRFYYELDTKNREYFWQQKDMIDTLYGEDLTQDMAISLLYMDVKELAGQNNPSKFESLMKSRLLLVSNPKKIEKNIRLYYATETRNWKEVNRLLSASYKEEGIKNAPAWNEQCWDLYLMCDDTLLIQNALVWMDEVVKIDPDFNHIDTYAALLFKAGKLEEAELKANEAIEAGRASNKNTKETEALLAKILAAKAEREAVK